MKRWEREVEGWAELVADLRAYAAGDVCLSAAVELLVAQHSLLERPQFRLRYIEHLGMNMARLDWEKLLADSPVGSTGEQAVVAVAASLAIDEWFSLRAVLPRLDAEATALVLQAVAAAAGHPEVAGALGSWGRG